MTMQSLVMSSLRKVLRGLFGRLTARGRSFLAAGVAAVLGGLAIPEPDLVRVGALLVVLPAVSALIAGRPGTDWPAPGGWTRRVSRPASRPR